MIYELLMFLGMINPQAAKLNLEEIDKITLEFNKEQFAVLLKLIDKDEYHKNELAEYLYTLELNYKTQIYKITLCFQK